MVINIDNFRYRGENMKEYANIFKVLSDVNRIKIIELLIKGESCSCELINELPISQPTLSYHLKLLAEYGLITSDKVGNRVNHTVNKDKVNEVSDFLKSLLVCNDSTCSV